MPTLKSVLCALSHNESDNAMHGLTLCWFLDSCIWSVVHMHKHDRCWWGHAVPQTTRSQMPTITKFSLSFNVLNINSFVTCAMCKASAMTHWSSVANHSWLHKTTHIMHQLTSCLLFLWMDIWLAGRFTRCKWWRLLNYHCINQQYPANHTTNSPTINLPTHKLTNIQPLLNFSIIQSTYYLILPTQQPAQHIRAAFSV